MARPRPEPPEECSQCGASVPRTAWACPECGADENTGWDVNPYLPHGDVDVPEFLTEDYDPTAIPRSSTTSRGRRAAGGSSPWSW